MKVSKLFVLVCLLVAVMMFVPASNAQTIVMAGAGSSAVFNALYDAAKNSGQCGTNLWSRGAGTYPGPFTDGGTLHDVRNAGIPDDNSNIWIAFDGTGPNYTDTTTICFYISVDSGIGDRGFLASPRAQLLVSAPAGTGAASKVNGYTDNVATLPQAIWNDINALATCGGTTNTGCTAVGTTMTVAFSDIRPEDAQYATFRSLAKNARNCAPNNPYTNASCYFNVNQGFSLGYGNWNSAYDAGPSPVLSGTSISSSFSTTRATPTYFEQVPGVHDGYTGQGVLDYAVYPVGALPVLVAVSNTDTSSTGFGATDASGHYTAKNVDLYTLAYIFDGVLGRTQDITGLAGSTPFEEIQREPLSGTYNTFEFTGILTHAIQASQEDGIYAANPAVYNPIDFKNAANGSIRYRAIGTGEMVKAVNGLAVGGPVGNGITTVLANRIGYAFWSYGNFLPLANSSCSATVVGQSPVSAQVSGVTTCPTKPTGHYLTVNGVDPLFNTVFDNPQGPLNFPTCGTTAFATLPCPTIPFTHLDDGSYPLWTIVRMIADGSVQVVAPSPSTPLGKIYNTLLTTSATKFFDFEEVANLSVFRIHRGASWGAQGNPANAFNPVNGTMCAPGSPYGIAFSNNFTGVDMGSDVGGGVFTIKADQDFAADYQGAAAPAVGFCGEAGGAFLGQTGQVN